MEEDCQDLRRGVGEVMEGLKREMKGRRGGGGTRNVRREKGW